MNRQLTLFDNLLNAFDAALRAVNPPSQRMVKRESPAEKMDEQLLSIAEKRHVAGLMRVNHAGEVCAQALYQGQALTARVDKVKKQMDQAAEEEIDHLAWCEQRLTELTSKPSIFNPLWYMGSFMIGALAGLAGDKWSLGFVAETETQVSNHIQKHLLKLPVEDKKSQAILKQMLDDETQHAEMAMAAGGQELPLLIKKLMQGTSKVMTYSSYYF